MNYVDIIILMIILAGGIIGFKRGVIKQSVLTIGMILVVVLSFLLKNPLSAFLYHQQEWRPNTEVICLFHHGDKELEPYRRSL